MIYEIKTSFRRSWLQVSALQGAAALTIGIKQQVYHTVSQNLESQVIRLNSNENQFGPSPGVLDAIKKLAAQSNYYTWTGREALRKKIAAKEGCGEDHILLGAGSTELLQLAGITFAPDHQKFISSYPTFPILMQQGEKFKAKWTRVPLNDSQSHDLKGLRQEAGEGAALIYLCNPNNPTGTKLSSADIAFFAKDLNKNQILFVDEAYLEFTDPTLQTSSRSLIHDHENVIVARTFSKIYGMAGLRVGYVCASPALIEQLKKYQVGFGLDISSISLAAASAAMDDASFVQKCIAWHETERQKIYASFNRWKVDFVPSSTSFIYFQTNQFKPNLIDYLGGQGILIRDYKDQPGFARVSIGSAAQVDRFIQASEGHLL